MATLVGLDDVAEVRLSCSARKVGSLSSSTCGPLGVALAALEVSGGATVVISLLPMPAVLHYRQTHAQVKDSTGTDN